MKDKLSKPHHVGIVLLAILVPPLALFLILKNHRNWFKLHKIATILTIIWCIFWVIVFINSITNPQNPTASTKSSNTSQTTSNPKSSPSKIETKTETSTSVVPFAKVSQNDATLPKGQTKVSQAGVNGEQTTTYEVKYQNGKETSRKQITQEVAKQPVDEITLVGTYIAPAPQPATQQPSTGQTYYCEDGTVATGDPSAKGRANSCYGHGGWVINHER